MPSSKPSVVLLHGGFADGTGWQHVIRLLHQDGYAVTAVQNPLTSLADAIATTRRAIEAQQGPVVLVGHSYGGAVITDAAAGRSGVKALVYVAAFAPDAVLCCGRAEPGAAPDGGGTGGFCGSRGPCRRRRRSIRTV